MAGELVERLRKPWDGTAGARERRDAERAEAADRIEALERENATLRAERDEARKALEPFAEVVARAEAAAAYFGAEHISEVPDSRTFGPMVITWGDLRRAAAIRNMGGGENESD